MTGRLLSAALRLASGAVAHATVAAVGPIAYSARVLGSAAGKARSAARSTVDAALRRLVRIVAEAALRELDLTTIVHRYVDIDALIGTVDLDAAARAVDLQAIVDRLDVEAIIARIDLDQLADGIDLERQIDRVNLATVADRLPIDALVAKMDLNALATLIDLDPLVDRVDLAAVIARIDLVGITRQVIDEMDLPGIIRTSTAMLTSEALSGARTQTRNADDAVAGFVGRLFGQADATSKAAR